MARPESETACMIAETNGMFRLIADYSPFLNFTSGVLSDTLLGIHSFVVNPGMRRNSPNVLETSFRILAIL